MYQFQLNVKLYSCLSQDPTIFENIPHIKHQINRDVLQAIFSEFFPKTIYLGGQYHHCVNERTPYSLLIPINSISLIGKQMGSLVSVKWAK